MLDYSDEKVDMEDVLENYKSLSENYDSLSLRLSTLESKYDEIVSDLEDLFKNSSIYEYKEYKNFPIQKRVEELLNQFEQMIEEIKTKDNVDDIVSCVTQKFS